MDHSNRLEELVAKHEHTLYRAALALLGDPQEAEDAVQTVFLRLLERDIQAYPGKERAFLTKTTINHCKNVLSATKRRDTVPLEEAVLLAQPEDQELFRAVMDLPEQYRTVVCLHYFEGYSFQEIARLLRIGPSAVSMRLHRARNMLKQQVGRF